LSDENDLANDPVIEKYLTSDDPEERVYGRFLATGVTDCIGRFMASEVARNTPELAMHDAFCRVFVSAMSTIHKNMTGPHSTCAFPKQMGGYVTARLEDQLGELTKERKETVQ
jgi:hypothetical protein